MMFKLTVVTLEKIFFEDDVISFSVPGADGYFQVFANHAPIIASLQPGKLTVTEKNNTKKTYAVSGGLLEFAANHGWILPDTIEEESTIDIDRAEQSRKRAAELLESKQEDVDIKNVKLALCRAENRIKIYHDFKQRTSHSVDNL